MLYLFDQIKWPNLSDNFNELSVNLNFGRICKETVGVINALHHLKNVCFVGGLNSRRFSVGIKFFFAKAYFS